MTISDDEGFEIIELVRSSAAAMAAPPAALAALKPLKMGKSKVKMASGKLKLKGKDGKKVASASTGKSSTTSSSNAGGHHGTTMTNGNGNGSGNGSGLAKGKSKVNKPAKNKPSSKGMTKSDGSSTNHSNATGKSKSKSKSSSSSKSAASISSLLEGAVTKKKKKAKKSAKATPTRSPLLTPSPSPSPSPPPSRSRSPSPSPRRRPTGMLSMTELCNGSEDSETNEREDRYPRTIDLLDETSSVDDTASMMGSETSKSTPPKKRAKSRPTTSASVNMNADTDANANAEKNDEDTDDGWSDHNRWYCNICKDGGELLCCDRCPRAFHMSCLGMKGEAIPDTEWFCKMCAECLDRRRLKKETREKARLVREAEKLERDAKKQQVKQMKEELLAQKSVQAIEHKAKRVLEMQDRILSRKKIKYKDKEEEKLGKLAEDLAQTVRSVKEKLEKLEKEDAALRKKEDALNKKKKGSTEDQFSTVSGNETQHEAVVGDRPTPTGCALSELPEHLIGQLMAIWDCISSFADILQLSQLTMNQLAGALVHKGYSPLVTEVHMCLLDLILEDREDEDYVSDDEAPLDEVERFRYEIQHAPLTVGVPTSNLLNSLSWPSVLCNLIESVPRYAAKCSHALRDAVAQLSDNEYADLDIKHKLALLKFLVDGVYSTDKVRRMLGSHVNDYTAATKAYNRAVLQDRKLAMEEEKKLREKQRTELTDLTENGKGSVKTWLKNDKKMSGNGNGAAPNVGGANLDVIAGEGETEDSKMDSGSASDSEFDDLDEEAINSNEEDLERLQTDGFISRHEYLSRKKQLDLQREKLRRREEKKVRKQKLIEQQERKRASAKKGIQEGLISKDADLLRVAIDKGKECELPDRIIMSASHVLEILEAEELREEEAEERKIKYQKTMRDLFVRTEPLGRDKENLRYWMFRGDHQHLYVQKPGSFSMKSHYDADGDVSMEDFDASASVWYCYSSQVEVTALMESLDERHPREGSLRASLKDNFEVITEDMPVSKPGLLISDLLNDTEAARKRARRHTGSPEADADFISWRNDKKTWRKNHHLNMDVDSLRQDLTDVEQWLSKRLKELGSTWCESGRPGWLKTVKELDSVQDAIGPVLQLESEVMSFQTRAQTLLAGSEGSALNEASKSSSTGGDNAAASSGVEKGDADEEEEEEDEAEEDMSADDGSILWPTKKCRDRWIAEVKRARTVATLATALGCFVQRLDIFGLSEAPTDDSSIMTRRAKTEKEKQSRKQRAAKKKQKKEEAEETDEEEKDEKEEQEEEEIAKDHDQRLERRNSADDWEEDCYICSEGGEVLCCDGCSHVFHFTCVGLRRVPRGKTFCHHCDKSVHPIHPVATRKRDAKVAKQVTEPEPKKQTGEDAEIVANSSDDEDDSDGSDFEVTVNTQSLNAATREDQWDVECGVCRLGGELLCCDGCPRAFHTKCIGIEIVPDDEWFCNECNRQTCGTCKKNKIRLDSHVICGSEDGTKGCERVFHLKCAKLAKVPKDDWYCTKCRKALQKAV